MLPRTEYARPQRPYRAAYQVFGEGRHNLVLVLDWASHLEALWEQPLLEEFLVSLARFARVVWFDMRGVGMSDPVPGGAAAPEDWVDDVTAVMDAVGFERATLIAQGHAVQLALMAAATHPERIESLVLLNGFARLARDDDYPAGMPERAHEAAARGSSDVGDGALAAAACAVGCRPAGDRRMVGTRRTLRGNAPDGAGKAGDLRARPSQRPPSRRAPTLVVQAGTTPTSDLATVGISPTTSPPRARGARQCRSLAASRPELLGAIEEFVTGSRRDVEDADRFSQPSSSSTSSARPNRRASSATAVGARCEIVSRRSCVRSLPHGGELVDVAGDGVLATFDGPARAVRCARHDS